MSNSAILARAGAGDTMVGGEEERVPGKVGNLEKW